VASFFGPPGKCYACTNYSNYELTLKSEPVDLLGIWLQMSVRSLIAIDCVLTVLGIFRTDNKKKKKMMKRGKRGGGGRRRKQQQQQQQEQEQQQPSYQLWTIRVQNTVNDYKTENKLPLHG